MRRVITALTPLIRGVCRLAFKIEFQGVENVPLESACIIAPNHVTYADPIWITIPMRRRIYYMAWDKPFEIPFLGFLMRAFGAFPVNLEAVDVSAQREAIKHLRSGHALVIFPEGGRARTGKVEPFKMGAFRLALTHGAPIVPVTIKGAHEIWPVGRWFPRPGKLTITYHPPIPVEPVGDISKAELKERARRLARKTHNRVAACLERSNIAEDESDRDVSLEAG
ncbi:MAG: 1-acyl-sn-glycerol-3-phosphate acyltransferase [Blastocatellia bacterium]|nr:1-acyl-sn-glycerol-3-phosphate acyltransferase [Blastocatellia bacterium]